MKKFSFRPQTVALSTPFEKNINQQQPFSAYPRPLFRRDSYLCLNGAWEFAVNGTPKGTILVPFPPESRLSGIERQTGKKDRLTYRRRFTLPEGFKKDKVFLHFGAADQYTKVYLNDCFLGENIGGYLPFSFDITPHLKPKNDLRVEITDPLDPDLPYGKQRKKRGGMWYTPISGIWQTVWLESVPVNHLEGLRITPSLDAVTIEVFGGEEEKTLSFPEGKTYRFSGNAIEIKPEDPHRWTPEDPYLYHFSLQSGEDEITSYFALRTIEARGDQLLLNGTPYFFHGLLDQGYFSDGIFLPATEEGLENDILQMKACGFNTLRKHIKLEPDLFYYYCDLHGMVVFQDMINSGRYHFLRDTAIPNVLIKKWRNRKATPRREKEFFRHAEGMMDLLYNHPSVCYYTIFNEGWGQFDADRVYRTLKPRDPTRLFDTTSGWFKKAESDVESEHIYFKPIRFRKAERPTVLSEFGGYSCRIKGHAFNLTRNTGYHYFTEDPKAFEETLIALYDREILPAVQAGLSGAVLTQVSDIEDETNGLFTYDRAVLKVDPDAMTAMAQRLFDAFEN